MGVLDAGALAACASGLARAVTNRDPALALGAVMELPRREKILAGAAVAAAAWKVTSAVRRALQRRRSRESGHQVIIVGAGFSCLALAIELVELGIPFRIIERQSGVGGCWRRNTYPGLACDTPVLLYSLWKRQNPDWSKKWAGQAEILAYMERVAHNDGLLDRAVFNTEALSCEWSDTAQQWAVRTRHLETGAERTFRGTVLIAATGLLAKDKIPNFPGLESFGGRVVHTARWPEQISLEGKRVGCIGTGASAIGLVPPCAEQVAKAPGGHFTVFQRTAAWIIPKDNQLYTPLHRLLFRVCPVAQWWVRWQQYWEREQNWPAFADPAHPRQAVLRQYFLGGMQQQVRDPELMDRLTPKLPGGGPAPVGALRMLTSNLYLPSLQKPHVTLCTSPIERFEPRGVRTADGTLHELDVVVAATGFDATQFTLPMQVIGRRGVALAEKWGGDRTGKGVVAKAYLGMTVPGFPNLFLMYGPNTNLGHNSVLVQIEAQSRYVASCVRQMVNGGIREVDLRECALRSFSDAMAARLRHAVWELAGSWYRGSGGEGLEGVNVCNWMGEGGSAWFGGTIEYIARTMWCDLSLYDQAPLRTPPPAATRVPTGEVPEAP
eukprot:TRINITY_DN55448_c0_g1_i1.p1 TRINITY_DN55448_c0_g1~~TRINITY_DN55448_c0_g1_i1.p1  ORF type:complete len:650 (+),score=157.70 TRINITY_DN55448_c0_g1_i1:129-1952(+)